MDAKQGEAMKRVSILGATGSVGLQALDVCARCGYPPFALTANQNARALADAVRRYGAEYAAIADESSAKELRLLVSDLPVKVLSGPQGVCEAAGLAGADIVLNAIVGIAGLRPTLAAIAAGKDVALANKETLVAAGEIVMRAAAEKGVHILPVDSEHSAVWQCVQGGEAFVRQILLTASGGPFFGYDRQELRAVELREALCHPNWNMGPKITVDSATMMNKGLELIEAVHLFHVPPESVSILVHRQSIVQSLVEYTDGSVLAQLGVPDMRMPIQYALTWPQRVPAPVERLDLAKVATLTFDAPDESVFTTIPLCRRAIASGGNLPAMLNGANEQAVRAMLAGEIRFVELFTLLERVYAQFRFIESPSLDSILESDRAARDLVIEQIHRRD